ncbi:MAG: hypothetical protein DWQ29_10815 [Planctomycetota bacterium]|nr:MAG: hypothetical protein DWQ29_10815 [Planctomycetota bacterium]
MSRGDPFPLFSGRINAMLFSRTADRRHRTGALASVGLFVVGAAWLIGCSSDADKQDAQPASGEPTAADPQSDRSSTADEPATPKTEMVTHQDGTKWIGGIPYAVYFDRPLEEYRDMTLVAATPGSTNPEMADPADEPAAPENGDDSTDPPADDASPSEDVDWAALASLDVLFEEATQIRNRLNTNLQTVATYNREVKLVVTDGNVLATLAAVVEKHPGEGSWKENAKFVRYLGYEIYLNGGTTGRSNFEATKEPFEQALTVMSGGAPPDVEVEDEFYFPDVADRAELMKHIDTNFGWLRSNINTESRLQEEKAAAIRVATVLAVLGQVMTAADFDSADNPEYQSMLKEFIDGNRAAATAAEAENFPELEAAVARVNNTCTPCHNKFRTNASDF